MLKNALVFAIDHWDMPTLGQFEQRLDAARFVECAASQPESAGWVAPRGQAHAALAESVAGQIILKLCTESKAVPSSVVKDQLEAELDKIEQATGRRPKGKKARELKEHIVHTLLPRAFARRRHTLVWIAAKERLVLVEAASMKKADAVLSRLAELLGGGLRLSPLQTETSPATAMAAWLADKEAPAGFTLDRECELKQPDHEKATVRYTRHALDIDELAAHIAQGKLPTQVALTWNSRVSFVLNEALALKKIKLLDVVLEAAGRDAAAGADFDSDVAIATGELRQLLAHLVDALGGPLALREAAARDAAAPDPGAAGSVAPWDALPA